MNILPSSEVMAMNIEERLRYFSAYKAFVCSLPFDEEALLTSEKRFQKTVHFWLPKFVRLFQPVVYGETEPLKEGPFILVSNHLGSFDQFLLATAFPSNVFHYMISASLLTAKNFFLGKAYVKCGAFTVDKSSPTGGMQAEVKALQFLLRGCNIAMFPEGTRRVKYGSDGTVGLFKKGAVSLAQIAQVPIVPIAINNHYKKGCLYVNVGAAMSVSYGDDIYCKTAKLREIVTSLWKENMANGARMITKKK